MHFKRAAATYYYLEQLKDSDGSSEASFVENISYSCQSEGRARDETTHKWIPR